VDTIIEPLFRQLSQNLEINARRPTAKGYKGGPAGQVANVADLIKQDLERGDARLLASAKKAKRLHSGQLADGGAGGCPNGPRAGPPISATFDPFACAGGPGEMTDPLRDFDFKISDRQFRRRIFNEIDELARAVNLSFFCP
jgi:hypothetical protein